MAIDNAAVAVRTLVEVKNGTHAHVRQIMGKLVQMFAAQDVFARFDMRTAGHNRGSLPSSPLVRL